MNPRPIALFALFFVGYNLVMASVILSLVPAQQRTLNFASGDFVPWPLANNPDFISMQSNPFQLWEGEVLMGTFEVYRLWNGSGVQLDAPETVAVKLMPPAYLYPKPGELGPPIWFAHYSSLVTVRSEAWDKFHIAPYTLIISTYTRDCHHNCSVSIRGTLTATIPSLYSSWERPLAVGGAILMAPLVLWVVGNQRRRGRTKVVPAPPPPM